MESKDKVEQAIKLLQEAHDDNHEGHAETGNYDDSFYQGTTCGAIGAALTILRAEIAP